MNPLLRLALRLLAFARFDVREDYERVRRLQRQLAALPSARYRTPPWDTFSDSGDGHRVPVRVFTPREQRRDELLLFFHGGGWVTGDIESYTPACATMADLTGCRVASVDYRLAPEHPFPAGLEDCYGAARGLLENPSRAGLTDAEKIVLVGDSAGGNLAAAVSLLLREQGHRVPRRQILLYPVTHWDHDPTTSPFESVRRHGEDYRLTNTEVEDYFDMYVPDPVQRRNRLVSPLMAGDLSAQPDTLLITAELDLLCDEGEAYAHALAEAGNRVSVHRIEHAVHGFITLPRFARPLKEAYELIDAFLDEGPSGHAAS
ncbi:Esterase/lipase [Brachybacterium faecium]|uniref:Esterase/lipase n=1 Tax=Brachybacterium faecium (strain ATCC 43885 / DSM 4810 / JCM 11609 / LMG 19847 / NBRC 14762 / NCIMB 9860 / 6-10) TaxID=446465 RepID=C7MI97_BRAFD|nr:alpha/beta hydrolase [Brachybacterium faecium]ACU84523.1 esterase/lipase [Brachybacterium faecium DSM 4810]SLN05293.1 Esterase/lipase [Brachybacterium faecium]